MEPPRFYHFAKASGLVKESTLDEVLVELRSSSVHAAAELPSVGLGLFQHAARLKAGEHHGTGDTRLDDSPSADSTDASLEGESAIKTHENITEQDRLLAEELVKRGFLNSWQATQLLDGRTKFSLGDYRILDSIGKGGYGHVFLGREDRNVRRKREKSPNAFFAVEPFYAIKVLPLPRTTPELTARFLHEIEIQKNLSHPNIVQYVASGRDGSVHYMVHEFIDGGDLRRLLRGEGRLPFDVAAAIISHLAQGIHYLHEKGLVHRDIKPANVLLSSDGIAKLADMGLTVPSRQSSTYFAGGHPEESSIIEREIDKATGLSGKVAGTVDFLAPDQIRAPDEPTPAWDIYSLGCTLYLLLSGSVPFPKGDTKQKFRAHLLAEAADPRVFDQSIPYDLVRLLRSMLEKDPNRRIRTAAEIAERLRPWIPPLGLAEKLRFYDDSATSSTDDETIGFHWAAPPKAWSLSDFLKRMFSTGPKTPKKPSKKKKGKQPRTIVVPDPAQR